MVGITLAAGLIRSNLSDTLSLFNSHGSLRKVAQRAQERQYARLAHYRTNGEFVAAWTPFLQLSVSCLFSECRWIGLSDILTSKW
jgi:hypothetical protein